MSNHYVLPLNQVTHVIIRLNESPIFDDMITMDEILYNTFEGQMICLFRFDNKMNLGFNIICPYGFKENEKMSKQMPESPTDTQNPELIRQFVQRCQECFNLMISKCHTRPFVDQALNALKHLYQQYELKSKDDLTKLVQYYNILFQDVAEWTFEPINPDNPLDYQNFKQLERLHQKYDEDEDEDEDED